MVSSYIIFCSYHWSILAVRSCSYFIKSSGAYNGRSGRASGWSAGSLWVITKNIINTDQPIFPQVIIVQVHFWCAFFKVWLTYDLPLKFGWQASWGHLYGYDSRGLYLDIVFSKNRACRSVICLNSISLFFSLYFSLYLVLKENPPSNNLIWN